MKLALWMLAAVAPQEIQTETVSYKHDAVELEGYLAWPTKFEGRLPAVIVVHEWKGHGTYVRMRAEMLAKAGYVAFAADMYGKGVFAKDHAEAGKLAGALVNDRTRMRARAACAYEVVRNHARVDPKRIAAIGYCFGGTTVLEMARSGLDLVAIASFHGKLATPDPEDAKKIRGRVLVLHGAEDRFIPAEEIAAFQDEMRKAKVDWQFVSFGGAVHSFTVKEAGNDPSKGLAYDEKADRRSWEALMTLLRESFGP